MASTSPLGSPATQCGPFSIAYGDVKPPSNLLILPSDGQPITNLTNPLQDPVAGTWNYTLDKLPLKSGTQFIVTLDHGSGAQNGNVSLIQTVGNSSDSSCLTPDPSPVTSFFTLEPAILSVCSNIVITWNTTRYQEPPAIRGFIPGGEVFDIPRPFGTTLARTYWPVSMKNGTQVVFLVQPATSGQGNGDSRTSPFMTVTSQGSIGTDCLASSEYSSTIVSASTPTNSTIATATIVAPTSASSDTTEPTKNVNIPGIIGGVLGALGFIALVCAAIVHYRPRKRKFEISAFEANTPTAPSSARAFTFTTPTQKRPLNAPQELNRPSEKLPFAHRPLPVASSTGGASSPRREDTSSPRGVSSFEERRADSVDIPVQPRSDVPLVDPASSTAADRSNAARRPPVPVARPDVGASGDGDEGGEGPAVEGRPAPSRTDGRAGRNRGRQNETETEYFRQTGAGAVRVVELPPSYNELQFRSTG